MSISSRLAWKNIWRNKTRTFVFVTATILGFAIAIFTINLMRAISDQRTNDAINIQTSHLQIHTKGYFDDKDVSIVVSGADQILSRVENNPNVAAVAERVVVNCVIASTENSVAGEIKGVKKEQEAKVSVLGDFIVEGTYLDPGKNNQIIISKRVADKLKIKLKSKVVITARNVEGEIVGGAFKVCGFFSTPSTPFDETTFITKYDDLSDLVGLSEPHEIVIKLKDHQELATSKNALQKELHEGLILNDWRELLPELTAFDSFLNTVGTLIALVVIIGLGFSLMNTMYMIVQERRKEIAMLNAIGVSKSEIFNMLLKESGFMMMTGAILGIVLGIIVVMISSKTGIRLTDDGGSLGIRAIVYPTLIPGLLIMIIVVAKVFTMAITLFPAMSALRIKTDALRD